MSVRWQVISLVLAILAVVCTHYVTALAPVVVATTDPADAPVLASGMTVSALSSQDGPVYFRVVQTNPDVGAVFTVENKEPWAATGPVVSLSASYGNVPDHLNAFRKDTRATVAELELSVCDFDVGNWTIGVEYRLQVGVSDSEPTVRIFEITFQADGGLSCEMYTALMVMGIPSLILGCALIAIVVWCCVYRRKKKDNQAAERPPLDLGLRRPPSYLRNMVGVQHPGGLALSPDPAPSAPPSQTLAQQLAQISRAAYAGQPHTGAPGDQHPPASSNSSPYAAQSQVRSPTHVQYVYRNDSEGRPYAVPMQMPAGTAYANRY